MVVGFVLAVRNGIQEVWRTRWKLCKEYLLLMGAFWEINFGNR